MQRGVTAAFFCGAEPLLVELGGAVVGVGSVGVKPSPKSSTLS